MDMIGDGFHVLAHFLIRDSRIYLGCLDVRVPEYSRHGLHGNAQAQHQCGKGMASLVEYTRQSKQKRTGKE